MARFLMYSFLTLFLSSAAFSAPKKIRLSKPFFKKSSAVQQLKSSKKKLNVRAMKPVIFPEKIKDNSATYEDYVRLVPTDIQGSQSETYVATKFADQAMQNFLNSPQVKNSSVGKTANTVQNAMKADVDLGGGPTASDPKAVHHKVSVQYLALQSQTKVAYSGWTNATLRMDARARETGVEISNKVFHDKDLVLNHTKNAVEAKSSVGVRWSW